MNEDVAEQRSSIHLKPCYLLADSRLLFERSAAGTRFLDDIVMNANSKRPSVAYIGASNGDNRSFYQDIFLPAFESFEVGERRLIVSRPSADDNLFLAQADIILLAGGSVEKGWNIFAENGFQSLIAERYRRGALLLGISAGAVQLGYGGLTEDESAVIPTFGFLGLYVGVHEEREDWKSLRLALSLQNPPVHGIGIPSGGGVMFYAGDLYPIRKPLFEIEIGVMGRREGEIYPQRFPSKMVKIRDESARNLN
jgi:cyanophycinase